MCVIFYYPTKQNGKKDRKIFFYIYTPYGTPKVTCYTLSNSHLDYWRIPVVKRISCSYSSVCADKIFAI